MDIISLWTADAMVAENNADFIECIACHIQGTFGDFETLLARVVFLSRSPRLNTIENLELVMYNWQVEDITHNWQVEQFAKLKGNCGGRNVEYF